VICDGCRAGFESYGLASPQSDASREGESARQPECERCKRLEAQLIRNSQGLLNILELRKLSRQVWGGPDVRYGALTRDEIESAISENQEALHVEPSAPDAPEQQAGEANPRG